MRRADRLFEIIQVLRRANGPITGEAIAAELEISKRTLYRDIAALMAQRVPIRGAAGLGYVLDRGFDMPPLMLNSDEVEAVVLGAQWVVANGDAGLARAAVSVLAKVAAIVPEPLRIQIEEPAVSASPAWRDAEDGEVDVARLRLWSLQGRKVEIRYRDERSAETTRTIWPFLIGYREGARVVFAWCELRGGFRMFRTDRILAVDHLAERYPERRGVLRKRWEEHVSREHARKASGRG